MFAEPFNRESLSYASSLMLIVLVPITVYVYVHVFRPSLGIPMDLLFRNCGFRDHLFVAPPHPEEAPVPGEVFEGSFLFFLRFSSKIRALLNSFQITTITTACTAFVRLLEYHFDLDFFDRVPVFSCLQFLAEFPFEH